MSPFEALTLMFVAGNFVITLLKFILELVKETKNSRPNFGELTSYFFSYIITATVLNGSVGCC